MNARIIWGTIISLIGLSIIFIPAIVKAKASLLVWVYGIPIFIIGIIILANEKEDKIEQINYKGGKNERNNRNHSK